MCKQDPDKDRGTRDEIAQVRWIIDKAKAFRKEVNMCFINKSKIFDRVDHTELWDVFREMGTPQASFGSQNRTDQLIGLANRLVLCLLIKELCKVEFLLTVTKSFWVVPDLICSSSFCVSGSSGFLPLSKNMQPRLARTINCLLDKWIPSALH